MLTSSIGRLACFYLVTCAIVACSGSELTFGGPLELSITSNAPVATTDSLVLNYDVTGRTLLGMAVTWGDGTVDSVFFAGAQTAEGRLPHLYSSDGAFTVTATVTDQAQGLVTEELPVTVTP